jgi:hypothetical protein
MVFCFAINVSSMLAPSGNSRRIVTLTTEILSELPGLFVPGKLVSSTISKKKCYAYH